MAVDGRLNVNVALNRPSYQVSNYSNQLGTFSANLANDGDNRTSLYDGSCAHTDLTTNPWWAVDLLAALYVAGVNFVNRDDAGTSGASNANLLYDCFTVIGWRC